MPEDILSSCIVFKNVRQSASGAAYQEERVLQISRPQPCFRDQPLTCGAKYNERCANSEPQTESGDFSK